MKILLLRHYTLDAAYLISTPLNRIFVQNYNLFFYYETGTYDSKTQFWAYGTDEFIADVGGFLVSNLNSSLM